VLESPDSSSIAARTLIETAWPDILVPAQHVLQHAFPHLRPPSPTAEIVAGVLRETDNSKH
jgi:hypothetical protein